ncbi:hypothetical protein [Kocuria rhizophila]|uniref:hypothetical protein n=1 Tax=Kocuria rhizophila TaxID=72000 RepID=UPI000A597C80|nr:hypothetical protein [Kocuria rhizophila]
MANLDWLPEDLLPAALRLAHADAIAYEAGREALEWSRTGPVSIARRILPTGIEQVYVEAVRPVPPRISLLFSDAVNHLRSVLDNVIFHMTKTAHCGELTESQERSIAFPIFTENQSMKKWMKSMRSKGLPQLTLDSPLGERILALQPFNDSLNVVPSMSALISSMWDQRVHQAHPIILLKLYSNTDKHRSLRTAVNKGFQSIRGNHWVDDQRSLLELTVGEILGETTPGNQTIAELHPSIMVERPESNGTLVGIGPELNFLILYVAHYAVPFLVTGGPKDQGLPPQIDLSDSGELLEDRIRGPHMSQHMNGSGK